MALAAIGSTSFLSDRNACPVVLPILPTMRTIDREGLNGHELVSIGNRGTPVIWQTFEDTSNVAAAIAAYVAFSGTLQTITNVNGSTVSLVSITLRGVTVEPLIKCVGGLSASAGTWLVGAIWELQPTA